MASLDLAKRRLDAGTARGVRRDLMPVLDKAGVQPVEAEVDPVPRIIEG